MTKYDDLIARGESSKCWLTPECGEHKWMREASAAIRELQAENARLLHLINMDWDCLPTCSSFGHDPECPHCNGEPKLRLLVERAEKAEAERDALRSLLRTAAPLAQATLNAALRWNDHNYDNATPNRWAKEAADKAGFPRSAQGDSDAVAWLECVHNAARKEGHEAVAQEKHCTCDYPDDRKMSGHAEHCDYRKSP